MAQRYLKRFYIIQSADRLWNPRDSIDLEPNTVVVSVGPETSYSSSSHESTLGLFLFNGKKT